MAENFSNSEEKRTHPGKDPQKRRRQEKTMADISESVCLNHPDTPAVARCASCNKPICKKCIVSRNGLNYCSEKCADRAASSVKRVDNVLENKSRCETQKTHTHRHRDPSRGGHRCGILLSQQQRRRQPHDEKNRTENQPFNEKHEEKYRKIHSLQFHL